MKPFSFQFSVFSALLVSYGMAAEPLPLSQAYWQDEAFLKSFNGSYRINARIEPTVTSEERGLLVSIQKLMADGKREDALKKLQGSPLAKSSAAIAYNIGNLCFELGESEKAVAAYQKAIEKFPNFRRAHRNLGYVYARENDWEKATPELEEAIRLGDQDGGTYGQLAYGRMQNAQYASALQAYRLAQVTQPESVDWKAGVAQCLQHLERNREALALMEEVIAARPDEPAYYVLQASILLTLDRSDEAMTNLELVRRIGKLDAENHLLLASLHLRAGSAKLARPLLIEAMEMDPKPAMVSALNALEFVTRVREWGLARELAVILDKAYPESESAKLKQRQLRLGALIDIDSGADPAGGAKVLEGLIKVDPLDGEALILLARYRVGEKRMQEAEMLLQQALRVEGSTYEASLDLAKLYVALKRYRDALEFLDEAMVLRPSQSVEEYRAAVLSLAEAAE